MGYDHSFGRITTNERIVQVDAFPLGINYEFFSKAAEKPAVKK